MRQEELLAIISGAQGPSLNLSLNSLGEKTDAELTQAFAAIPNSVTSLDLSLNSLGEKTGAELTQAFAAIPHSVTSLDLGHDNLGKKTGAELAEALAAIPHSVTSLNLGHDNLGKKTGAELAEALAAIPRSVTSLNLEYNNLCARTGAELAQAFAAIPHSVTSLSLRDNNLCARTGAELAQAFAAIPHSVTSLNLGENFLGKKISTELAEVLAAIPRSVTSLDLSHSRLDLIGTVKKVGNLLLDAGLRIILADTSFERALNKYMLGVYQQQAAQLVNSEASQIGIGCLGLVNEFLTGATASTSAERVRAAKMEQGQIGAKERKSNSISPQFDTDSASTAPLQVTEQRDSTPVRRPGDYSSNGEEGEVVEEKSQEAWKRTQKNKSRFNGHEFFDNSHQSLGEGLEEPSPGPSLV